MHLDINTAYIFRITMFELKPTKTTIIQHNTTQHPI